MVGALGGLEAARAKKAALLGLAFKPGTDGMGGSPAIGAAQTRMDAGVAAAAYDPEGMGPARLLDLQRARGLANLPVMVGLIVCVIEGLGE